MQRKDKAVTKARNTAVGRRIREARKECGLTQKKLADIVGMDPKYLSRIENGHSGISRELLVKIGNELDKSLDYFYIDDPNVKPENGMNAEIALKLRKCSHKQLLVISDLIDAVLKTDF